MKFKPGFDHFSNLNKLEKRYMNPQKDNIHRDHREPGLHAQGYNKEGKVENILPNLQPRMPFSRQKTDEDDNLPPNQVVFPKHPEATSGQINNRERVYDSVTIQNQPQSLHQNQPRPLPATRDRAYHSEGHGLYLWSFMFFFGLKTLPAAQFIQFYHNTMIGYILLSLLPAILLTFAAIMSLIFETYHSYSVSMLIGSAIYSVYLTTAMCFNYRALNQLRAPKERLRSSKTATGLGVIAAVIQALPAASTGSIFLFHYSNWASEYYYRNHGTAEVFLSGGVLLLFALFSLSLWHLGVKNCRAVDEVDKIRVRALNKKNRGGSGAETQIEMF